MTDLRPLSWRNPVPRRNDRLLGGHLLDPEHPFPAGGRRHRRRRGCARLAGRAGGRQDAPRDPRVLPDQRPHRDRLLHRIGIGFWHSKTVVDYHPEVAGASLGVARWSRGRSTGARWARGISAASDPRFPEFALFGGTMMACPARTGCFPRSAALRPRRRFRHCVRSAATPPHPLSCIRSPREPGSARTPARSSTNCSSRPQTCQQSWTEPLVAINTAGGTTMTALVYPPLQENRTVSDHRHATVRWARRALRPDTAVIIGQGTTGPGSGALTGRVGYQKSPNTPRRFQPGQPAGCLLLPDTEP